MRRCSTSLVIREMQIKTTVRSCFTPIIMFVVKKTDNNKCWRGGCEVTADMLCCWLKHTMVQNRLAFSQNGIELPYDLEIALLSI